MAELIIFGGTAEGRELAEYAAVRGLSTLVSVTSEYGEKLLGHLDRVAVRCGPLDEAGIGRLLEAEAPRLVMDATHPYAVLATAEISSACKKRGTAYLRVRREELGTLAEEGKNREAETEVYWVHTWKEAADLLARDQRPVLLTTGSKELANFAAIPYLKERIFARVLPDSKVLAACESLGLSGRQIMAMQGPFSVEMNCAMIHGVGAGWLVTKESGKKGGFEEKLEAAQKCRVSVIVIGRPAKEDGISLKEAKKVLEKLAMERERGDDLGKAKFESSNSQTLYLIGMGMGNGRQLTLEALDALRCSDAVLGAPRMLEGVREWTTGKRQEEIYLGGQVLDWLRTHREYSRVAVVYSGDTGFYSGCGSLLRQADEEERDWAGGLDIQVYPGISTLSCLCARLKKPWEDIYPASVHGRDRDVERLLQEHGRIFLLLGGKLGVGGLCRRLTRAGFGRTRVYAGVRLGYPGEELLTGQAKDLQGRPEDSLAAVILEWQANDGAVAE